MGPIFKVSPKFIGPYRIHRILPHNEYEVISEKDLEKWVVHWNHIKITTSDLWFGPELKYIDVGPDISGTRHSSVNSDSSGNVGIHCIIEYTYKDVLLFFYEKE